MKRIAVYPLHYGKEYLAWSIRSIQDAVDQVHVLYTATPSFGRKTELVNPDTEEELHAEALRFATVPVIWYQGTWNNRTEHYEAIRKVAEDVEASQVLIGHADEIWQPGTAADALMMADNIKSWCASGGVGRLHLWRSFGRAKNTFGMPERILNVGYTSPMGFLNGLNPIIHVGHAQSEELMRYAAACNCSGGSDISLPIEPFDRRLIHSVLGDHPNFDKETIS